MLKALETIRNLGTGGLLGAALGAISYLALQHLNLGVPGVGPEPYVFAGAALFAGLGRLGEKLFSFSTKPTSTAVEHYWLVFVILRSPVPPQSKIKYLEELFEFEFQELLGPQLRTLRIQRSKVPLLIDGRPLDDR